MDDVLFWSQKMLTSVWNRASTELFNSYYKRSLKSIKAYVLGLLHAAVSVFETGVDVSSWVTGQCYTHLVFQRVLSASRNVVPKNTEKSKLRATPPPN